jgi:hypothetical protein
MLKTVCVYLALALGAGALFNGLFMLLDPWRWYLSVPGVTTTGLFNQHFIRDIGLIFLLLGGAFTLGAVRETYRVVLWSGVAVWLCGHALFHFWEVAVGICSPPALARDFPAVTLPAILACFLALWAWRAQRRVT